MNRDKILKGVKGTLKVVAHIGITFLCSAFAGSVTGSSNAKPVSKACMAFGGAVVGEMIADKAAGFIDESVDNLVFQFDSVMKILNDATKGTEESK